MPLNQSLLSLRSLVNKFSPSHCISSVFLFFCFFKYTHWISWKFSYWPISWCNLHGQSFPLPTSALLLFELAQGTEKDTRTTYFLTNSKQFTECSVPGFVLKLHQASIIPSKEHPGLMSFRMDWLDLLAVQGTLKSLLQHHSSKASIIRRSAFFTVQLSHPYMTTGKTIALTRRTFVAKVMTQLLNMLSRS